MSQKQEPLIEVANLTKHYQSGATTTTALDDVSFSINKGESAAIVGPSGSGKTTLLEVLAGLNSPSNGSVTINGHNVHEGSDRDVSEFRNKTIGFVFQMMHLQEYFTARDNVMLPMLIAGVPQEKAKNRAEKLLIEVGLKERMDHNPSKLSGGEQQRVAIARALANKPKIILADEPTGKLDRENADVVMNLLHDVTEKGVSVLLITHDEHIAKQFKRVIHLSHGKLQ